MRPLVYWLVALACLLGSHVGALPHPQEEDEEGGEEFDEELVGATSSSGKLSLGLKRPTDDEEEEDAESVAFFNNLEEEEGGLVGATKRNYDARTQGLMTPVKNQSKCASCTAFANMAIVETCFKKVTGQTIILSEQQYVDCAFGFQGAEGCSGGALLHTYLKWSELKEQLVSQADYPYVAVTQACPKPRPISADLGAIAGNVYYTYRGNEAKLKALVDQYSVAAAGLWFNPESLKNFRAYRGGVFDGCVAGVPGTVGHAMAVVGYGTEGGVAYWLLKNSWGTGWGEAGYIKMRRGVSACELGDSIAAIACKATGNSTVPTCSEYDENCEADEEAKK